MKIKIIRHWPNWWQLISWSGHHLDFELSVSNLAILRIYINYFGTSGIMILGIGIDIRFN